ncbi:MAG: 3-methyl-2-oxobutanoate hydroxymethyltransferase [Chloroflexi bacterium RBG_19FT_COMBO_47_9]|nr:MAG: 3-methyl-2-oxobutanoate hydroxymethyltransferase [Chloroflexi bacterium RBG_19FT_COMBO_47_9]
MSAVQPPITTPSEDRKKVTVNLIQAMKRRHEVISMLTAYDYPTALVMDQVGLDIILVGDSLGMVVLGYESTLPVTMEEMIHHCKAVARGAKYALLVGDMPFMSYQISTEAAVRNAGRFLQEGSMNAVKLEGGSERVETIRAIINAGIPVMGHLGLTPQSVHKLGGYKPQGRDADAAYRLVEDALILQEAGCFSMVLESIPGRLAQLVSERLDIPTLGIGAGVGCDGQVLVMHDLLGIFERFTPRFVKRYANLAGEMRDAFSMFTAEVKARKFPGEEHTVEMEDPEWKRLEERIAQGS